MSNVQDWSDVCVFRDGKLCVICLGGDAGGRDLLDWGNGVSIMCVLATICVI